MKNAILMEALMEKTSIEFCKYKIYIYISRELSIANVINHEPTIFWWSIPPIKMVSHWGMVDPFAFRTLQWDHNLGLTMPGEPRCCQTVWSKGCYDDPKWLVNSSTTCVLMLSHLWSWSKVCNLQALRHPRLVSFIGAMEPTGWWWNMVKLVARWCLLPPNLHCRGCALKIPSLMIAWALVGSTIWGDDLQWKTLTNFTHHKTWITTG